MTKRIQWDEEKLGELIWRYKAEVGYYMKSPPVPALGYKFDNVEHGPLEQTVLLPGDVAPYRLALGPHGELLRREAVIWEMREEF